MFLSLAESSCSSMLIPQGTARVVYRAPSISLLWLLALAFSKKVSRSDNFLSNGATRCCDLSFVLAVAATGILPALFEISTNRPARFPLAS